MPNAPRHSPDVTSLVNGVLRLIFKLCYRLGHANSASHTGSAGFGASVVVPSPVEANGATPDPYAVTSRSV